jgi:hypothetical protein
MDINMADMFGKVVEMQKKVAEAQAALAVKTVSVEAGGGMVKVTANGAMRITSVRLEPQVIDPSDQELLEDLVVAGVNLALDKASEMARAEMAQFAGNLMPPGLDMGALGL